MNGIYDNGRMLLGTVKDIIEFLEHQIKIGYIEKDEHEDILIDLKDLNSDSIVAVYYDYGMGYDIYRWDRNDIVSLIDNEYRRGE